MATALFFIGLVIVGLGVLSMVVLLIARALGLISSEPKEINQDELFQAATDYLLANSTIDVQSSPLGNKIRFSKIANLYTDKIRLVNGLEIGFLHLSTKNYLTLGALRKEIPLSIKSEIAFENSEGDHLALILPEKPYEYGRRFKGAIRQESKIEITESEYDFFNSSSDRDLNIVSITYRDSKDELIRHCSVNTDQPLQLEPFFKFQFLFRLFFSKVQEIAGTLTFRDPEDKSVSISERSRHIPQLVKDQVWRRDEGKCVTCGEQNDLEFDHIIPWSKGGANTYRNIQLLCEKCNRLKSDTI